MVMFGGVGRGGANMEEAGYWLHVLRGHSFFCPPSRLALSLCFLATKDEQPRLAYFPSATMVSTTKSGLPGTMSIELSETMRQKKCFLSPSGDSCHILPHW